ncbi:hypothetical protein FB559_3175 [Actinoallomurus bryophytorum]|uniref:WXG100 family type VII secretion target n=2 Tax=Actinoallomurus bryophytorum TaxID=1490222 RepID=A0A543CKM4_9ACTN|nr:hypothetical protein FB559_3175 [Actinoallomurus bryophytorum]
MHIDHAELRQAALAFMKEGQDLADTVDHLLGKIDELGDIYGDDDPGREAKKAFTQAREEVVRYSGALCSAYGAVGDNLSLMNENVVVANWNIIASLPTVDVSTVPRFGP